MREAAAHRLAFLRAPLPLVLNLERRGFIVLFVLPTLLLVTLVSFYPILYAFNTSLYETRFLEQVRFVGSRNYLILLQDPAVWHSIRTSLAYTFGSGLITLPLGLGLALLLNRPLRYEAILRGIIIMPWVVSQTVSALLWTWLLEPAFGPVNYLLTSSGQQKVFFLADPALAIDTVILANVWISYPFPTILLLAALKTVPPDLYEAAAIDGGGRWSCFRFITLPFLRPTLLSTAIMLTLLYLNMVTLIYIMTGGGPLAATETLSVRVFKDSFLFLRMGFASALGSVIFLLNIVFSSAYIFLLQQREDGVS